MFLCAIVVVRAQTCGSADIRRWTGTSQPGDHLGVFQAPITIDGNSVNDWDANISGPYAYSGLPKGGFESAPYPSPLAPSNVQKDGLKDSAAGPYYDNDAVGQDHRDLRYFAFTYDAANVYFIFRRPKNNTAQVSLYYFIDINVDGYMKDGEPVIKVTFNNSGSSIQMGYYKSGLPNGIPASALDAVKGNIMTAPAARARTNNTSEWVIGAADGWSMPGTFVALGNGVNLPALGSVSGTPEVFAAQTLTDQHSDGTVPGYGVEFAVPFKYLGMYTAAGLTSNTSLDYNKVFTWHVSLVGGNSGISGAEDNAGGCCSGLAVSGLPEISNNATFSGISGTQYRLSVTYGDLKGVNTIVGTNAITIIDPQDANGVDLPQANVQAWVINGVKNVDCNTATSEATEQYFFASYSQVPDVNNVNIIHKEYRFVPAGSSPSVLSPANGSACFYFDIQASGFPAFKTASMRYGFDLTFDIASNDCFVVQSSGSTGQIVTLPVKLVSFNAIRNNQNVNLSWQTATEDKNKGFSIERTIGAAGGWQSIGFVSSQAINGTSNSPISYQFTDYNNSTKGITQYRLKQVDIDNRSAYSSIRSVRGMEQSGKTIVFPNPSNDGKVSVVFEDINVARDVTLIDMTGRTVKQWKGVTSNNIQIENLITGFYSLRIINNETGEQVVEKLVVNKR